MTDNQADNQTQDKKVTFANVQEIKKQKGPGRPRKEIVTAPFERRGIVQEPLVPDYVVEIVYEKPKLFKKILCNAYRGYMISILTFEFTKTHVKLLSCEDGKAQIIAILRGKYLNHYYCRDASLKISVKRELLSKLFKNISKTHYKVIFVLKEEDKNSKLYVTLKEGGLVQNDDTCEIPLVPNPPGISGNEFNDTGYPLSFRLPSKHFKDLVSSMNEVSDTMTIQKNPGEPLTILYGTDQSHPMTRPKIYSNNNEIQLRNLLPPDDIFSATLTISNIKPFSNANLGDWIYICIDKYNPANPDYTPKISFTSDIDRVFIDGDGEGYVAQVKVFADTKRIAGRL